MPNIAYNVGDLVTEPNLVRNIETQMSVIMNRHFFGRRPDPGEVFYLVFSTNLRVRASLEDGKWVYHYANPRGPKRNYSMTYEDQIPTQ